SRGGLVELCKTIKSEEDPAKHSDLLKQYLTLLDAHSENLNKVLPLIHSVGKSIETLPESLQPYIDDNARQVGKLKRQLTSIQAGLDDVHAPPGQEETLKLVQAKQKQAIEQQILSLEQMGTMMEEMKQNPA